MVESKRRLDGNMSTALFGILLAIAFWVAIILVIIRIVKYLIRYGMEYGINYYFDEKERREAAKQKQQDP